MMIGKSHLLVAIAMAAALCSKAVNSHADVQVGIATSSALAAEREFEHASAKTGKSLIQRLLDESKSSGEFVAGRRAHDASSILTELDRLSKYAALMIIAPDSWLDIVFHSRILGVAGEGQPFEKIDAAFKRPDSNVRGKTIWAGIGWIPWSTAGTIRNKGGCNPRESWSVCTEKTGADSYVVKQKEGHEGWPIDGIGITSRSIQRNRDLANRLMDWFTSEKANMVLRDYFVVVPHDSVRTKREVVFELWDANGSKPLATTQHAGKHPKPQPAAPPGGEQKFNACGGKATACPPYMIPPDVETRLRNLFQRKR